MNHREIDWQKKLANKFLRRSLCTVPIKRRTQHLSVFWDFFLQIIFFLMLMKECVTSYLVVVPLYVGLELLFSNHPGESLFSVGSPE